jgi:hypothetical protein
MVANPQQITFTRDPGDADAEDRTYYKGVTGPYLPSAVGASLIDLKRHKVVLPILAELAADTVAGKAGQLVLVLLSRYANDEENTVGFLSDLTDNRTTASVYRLKGNPLNGRRF